MGIRCPIIRKGDDLSRIVIDSILRTTEFEDKDVIGITESIVARAEGNYVTVDEVCNDIKNKLDDPETIILVNPIYSRNRFSMILKAVARACKNVIIVMPPFDEVGNPAGVNSFTGVNIRQYYREIVESEGATFSAISDINPILVKRPREGVNVIYCALHNHKDYSNYHFEFFDNVITLADICNDKCEYGLLGSNKANEELLKLFPSKKYGQALVEDIQKKVLEKTDKHVSVMIYGDGAFKDPISGIWEFADPVVSPAYTKELNGVPNEIKIKAFADDQFKDLSGKELDEAIKQEIKTKSSNLVGNMDSQGTTPRRYVDLLGSLMDLTSGSGDKGTPVILVKHYFSNYSEC